MKVRRRQIQTFNAEIDSEASVSSSLLCYFLIQASFSVHEPTFTHLLQWSFVQFHLYLCGGALDQLWTSLLMDHTAQKIILRILLQADVWRSFLEDLLHGRGQVVHLALVFCQRHLEGLVRWEGGRYVVVRALMDIWWFLFSLYHVGLHL